MSLNLVSVPVVLNCSTTNDTIIKWVEPIDGTLTHLIVERSVNSGAWYRLCNDGIWRTSGTYMQFKVDSVTKVPLDKWVISTLAINDQLKIRVQAYSATTNGDWFESLNTLVARATFYSADVLEVNITNQSAVGSVNKINAFHKGESKVTTVTIKVNGVAQDLRSDTITFTMKTNKTDGSAVFSKVADVSSNGINGVASFITTPSESNAILVNRYFCDIVWLRTGGQKLVIYDDTIDVIQKVGA